MTYKYVGVLPYARNNSTNTIYFLLGKEAIVDGWSESGKWSDFGGKPDDNDTDSLESASRECFEETMGILGCHSTLKNLLMEKSQTIYIKNNNAMIYLLEINYDENLPIYFNRIFNYLSKCTIMHPTWSNFKYIPSCPQGYCEKIEMSWFPYETIKDVTIHGDTHNIYRKSFIESMNVIFNESMPNQMTLIL